MDDKILESFLRRQEDEGLALAHASDIVDLSPLDGPPAQHYHLRLNCRGLVRRPGEAVQEANRFEAGIYFGDGYLRHVDPFRVVTWFGPRWVWHPNISQAAPFICVGRITPGTSLVDIVFQIYELVTYQKVTLHDGLNGEACNWARLHQALFPIDRRPLKRRAGDDRPKGGES